MQIVAALLGTLMIFCLSEADLQEESALFPPGANSLDMQTELLKQTEFYYKQKIRRVTLLKRRKLFKGQLKKMKGKRGRADVLKKLKNVTGRLLKMRAMLRKVKPKECLIGFARNGNSCVDVNECKFKNGFCEHVCENHIGFYKCACRTGYKLARDGRSCVDVNECFLNNGHGPCRDRCINTVGSFECRCDGGTRLAKNGMDCVDVNECGGDDVDAADETDGGVDDVCSHGCINFYGGVYCTCLDGFDIGADGRTCIGNEATGVPQDLTCPKLDPPRVGSYVCSRSHILETNLKSYTGRKILLNRPGTTCKLECPAGFRSYVQIVLSCGIDGKWQGGQDEEIICVARGDPNGPTNYTIK